MFIAHATRTVEIAVKANKCTAVVSLGNEVTNNVDICINE